MIQSMFSCRCVEQGGFVRRRGTPEQSSVLRELACIAKLEKRTLLVAFLDCKSAFDRVNRHMMLIELHEAICGSDWDTVGAGTWKLIASEYESTTAKIGNEILENTQSMLTNAIHSGTYSYGIATPSHMTEFRCLALSRS